MKRIYLDHNATTPVHPLVAKAMRPYMGELFGNPSSLHWFGLQTKKALEKARIQTSGLLHCEPDEVVFTSGGTESNNLALKGVAFAQRPRGGHIITSLIEHPAVLEVCKYLENNGFNVSYLPVDSQGLVDPGTVAKAIRPDTILISIMHANNETGTIQPISEISGLAHAHGIPMHTDAAQTAGKISVDTNDLGADLVSLAGHKFCAPKGVGALFIRKGTILEKLMHGADHEKNLRAGTENVLEISGFGMACELAAEHLNIHVKNMIASRDSLHQLLMKGLDHIHLIGHPEKRLPNTLNIGFEGIEAEMILSSVKEVAASAGAACHAGQTDASYVLKAMDLPDSITMGAIRFSTGWNTSQEEVEEAARKLTDCVKKLQKGPGISPGTKSAGTHYRLTEYTRGLGCACKIPPDTLEKLLEDMPVHKAANVLVDQSSKDDAAVYKLENNLALVQTIDFLTPMVDDPYAFGVIAAANALSDIYAMGADPICALNVAGFPSKRLPISILKEILKGAYDKTKEAGIPIVGGHSIEDSEPKFGLVVSGLADPEKILRNSGANPGDVLILTKPVGTGIISTAIKRGIASQQQITLATKLMGTLNKDASHIIRNFPVSSCTDVSGFGLLGHLLEMTRASGIRAEIFLKNIPLIEGTRELAAMGAIPGGTRNNLEYGLEFFHFSKTISETDKLILSDAQTSGGLLFTLKETYAPECCDALQKAGISEAGIIGKITNQGTGMIHVRK